jgi:hypothetical protein
MGKWLILYSTITGNTRMVAEAMLAVAPPGSFMQDIRELDPAELRNTSYEVVVAGYWLKRGGPDPQMAKILPEIADRQVVLFETHGALPGSEHAVTAFARAGYLLGENCEILGTFSCQGKINPRLLERRLGLPETDPHAPTQANKARWSAAAGHPNEEDFSAVQAFAVKMQRKAEALARFRG